MEKIVFEKNGSNYCVDITPKGMFTSVNGSVAAYTVVENLPKYGGWVYYIPKDAIKKFFDELGITPQDVVIVHPTAEKALELQKALLLRN